MLNEIFEKLSEEEVNNFLVKFGIGPNYKPTLPKTRTCPKCKKKNVYTKEIHPDTDMNDIVLYCSDCGYEKPR